MQQVRKKNRKHVRHGRVWLLLALVVILVGSAALWYITSQPEETINLAGEVHSGTLYAYEAQDVAALHITLRAGESWQLTQGTDGGLTVDGDDAYEVDETEKDALLSAAAMVTYEEILTEDASAYAENFEDFGLATPRVVAEITYRDGTVVTLRIGDGYALEESGWSYMTVDGDPNLYALDDGTADALSVRKAELHPVEQPVLHKARFDQITFTGADGTVQAQWILQGEIGGDAQDRWLLTYPLQYPAEGENISNLQDNIANIRMGEYVGEATAENLTLYGFDTPRFVLSVHMAEGSIGTTDSNGEYTVTEWPESTFTLTVGGAKSEYVDYVRMNDSIYLTSHFTLNTLMSMNPSNTLTRYVVPTALGNLAQLTINRDGNEEIYAVTRTEQVAENNDLVYDEDGQVVYDTACTRNGQTIAYSSFEAAYHDLMVVTVSGTLPQGWQAEKTPHTVYTFTQTDGTVHVVSLTAYDAFHDAVTLDGSTMFYLIKDGMKFNLG